MSDLDDDDPTFNEASASACGHLNFDGIRAALYMAAKSRRKATHKWHYADWDAFYGTIATPAQLGRCTCGQCDRPMISKKELS